MQRNPYCYSWYEANIPGLQVRNENKPIKVRLHLYSKSISTTKCVISPLFKSQYAPQMWNRAPTPNRYAPPART